MMRKEILLAGTGGQGIQLIGRVLKQALHYKGHDVAYSENYGPEARGGKSFCEIVIKEHPLDWPGVMEADLFATLSQEAYQTLKGSVKEGGVVIYDPVLVKPEMGKGFHPIPLSEIASKIEGRVNMVLLGVILAFIDLISIGDIFQVLKEEDKFSSINQRSLEKGYEIGESLNQALSGQHSADG
jgi:2-oxoglutarate ferredoxin oxidoreductase subunit gamma